MGTAIPCCVATADTQNKEERELLVLTGKYASKPPGMVPEHEYMNRIVNDASRRVRELKRVQRSVDEDIEMHSLRRRGTKNRNPEEISKQVSLSSIGEALDWSPIPTPKKGKKGFVRLSSYEN